MKGKRMLYGLSVAAVTMLASCLTPTVGSAHQTPVTINFWHEWNGYQTADLHKLVVEFNKTHPNIHVNDLGSVTDQKEITAMAGGTSPDVAVTFNVQNVPEWAKVGALQPLDAYITKTNFNIKDYIPSLVDLGRYKGNLYALPIETDTYMLFYNKKLFRQAGIKTPPKTISELKADALKLTVKGSNGYKQMGFLPDYPWLDPTAWPDIFGASWYNASTKQVTPDSPGNLAALNFARTFYSPPYNKAAVQKFESGFGKRMSPNNPFFAGQLGMDWDGEWLPSYIQQFAPNFEYGVVPMPYPDNQPQLKNTAWSLPGDIFIPSNAPHKDEAWTFVQWLLADKQIVRFCADIDNLPANYSALRDPDLVKMAPGLKPFVDQMKHGKVVGFPAVPFANEYMTALSTEDQKVLYLEETAQQAMQKVKNQVQPLANKQ